MIARSVLVLLAALLLAACGGQAPTAGPGAATPVAAVQPTAFPGATALPASTDAPTAPTSAPAPAQPTTAPTGAPEQPTAVAEPSGGGVPSAGASGGEILFLRGGALTAVDLQTKRERRIAEGVSDFAPAPDGAQIALVRNADARAELWTVRRDGNGLTRLTDNGRVEGSLSWSPDSAALVFASAEAAAPPGQDWIGWSRWCAGSEVHLLELAGGAETTLAPGCDPAFSPDGRRIAYAAPPSVPEPGFGEDGPLTTNSIRLINRQGQNGWDFARAEGPAAAAPGTGRVVYGPVWSPDGGRLLFQRFLGYQVLVDINQSELAGSFDGKVQPLLSGAGWLPAARFTPDGRSVAIVERNIGDARGLTGYDIWSVTVLRLEGSREVALPNGPVTMQGTEVETLVRGQMAAWSPDGARMVVQLPPGWRADLPRDEPVDADSQPGELWLWHPGTPPSEQIAAQVDFASPIAWLK
ncbi:MAG TPA: hypothetical protein VFS21_09035 [Roseiflexaceae bacterium]|nr:hypothetical protein [Roseiflexaceae bacterium]